MIENFDPSKALRSLAPTVTAIIYTGDGMAPVALDDLALSVDTGEVIPLNESVFAGAAGRTPSASAHKGSSLSSTEVAGLLQCEASVACFHRVATLALLQATTDVPTRRTQASLTELAIASTTKARVDLKSGSLDAMLAEMDAAAHKRPEFAK